MTNDEWAERAGGLGSPAGAERIGWGALNPSVSPMKVKVLPILLGVSLAANAALWIAHGSGGGGWGRGGKAGAAGAEADRDAPIFLKPEGPATGESKAIAAALQSGDLARLRDELRAAGVEEDLVRAIVAARLAKRYEARLRALQPRPDPNRPWWKNDEDGSTGQTREQREMARALRDEQRAEMERLLGRDPRADDPNSWLARTYGYLPVEKRDELRRIEQDYNELSSELRRELRGFTLPSDTEKLQFLAEERRRDLESLLSPQELEAFELRQSRTAQNMRWRMTQMDASEAEFRAIFELQKEFDDRFNEHDQYGNRIRTMGPDDWRARSEAEKAMREQIRSALGPERYADYVRSQDGDYQQLRNAARRFDLPPDTAKNLHALRDDVPRRAGAIADDASLSLEQKREALKRLAQDTRNLVRTTMGSEVADAYFKNNGMSWLGQLEQGTIVTFDEHGQQSRRRLEQASRPAGR